jgi:hypothetical protein
MLNGDRVADIAPNMVKLVSRRRANSQSMKDGLTGLWLSNVGPDLGSDTLVEFFILWQRLAGITLVPEQEDVFVWRWSWDGQYSSKSPYEAFFTGVVKAPISDEILRSRALYSCKFFAWLALNNRCWMTDRLGGRGLPCGLPPL